MSKYTSIRLCSSCSLISARWRQQCILYYFSTFLFFCACTQTHTGAPHPFVSVSNLWTHTSLRRFHSSRPTVFLLDDTVAPANRLQRHDISDISKNLTFMGLVFFLSPPFCMEHIWLSASSCHPGRLSEKVWGFEWAVAGFLRKGKIKKGRPQSFLGLTNSALRGNCRRSMHFHLYLACTLPEADTYACLHSQLQQPWKTAK